MSKYDDEFQYWKQKIMTRCNICNGSGVVKNKSCQCYNDVELYAKLSTRNFPRRYLVWDWNKCKNQNLANRCAEYCDSFEDHYYDGKSMYLYGKQGHGKTTLVTIIGKEISKKIKPGTNKRFNTLFLMMSDIVKMPFEKKELFENIKNDSIDLLIIDNLGSEFGMNDNKFSAKILDEIIRNRTNKCLPTIINSNFSPKELETQYCKTVKDLIGQFFILILVDGESFRVVETENDDETDDF